MFVIPEVYKTDSVLTNKQEEKCISILVYSTETLMHEAAIPAIAN
jgi:hypothetical protein